MAQALGISNMVPSDIAVWRCDLYFRYSRSDRVLSLFSHDIRYFYSACRIDGVIRKRMIRERKYCSGYSIGTLPIL